MGQYSEQVREQVEVIVEAKIMNRIDKLTATREDNLYNALPEIPRKVIEQCIKNLGTTGQIRKVQTNYGIIITRKETSNSQIIEAIKARGQNEPCTRPYYRNYLQQIDPRFETNEHYADSASFGDSSVEEYNAQQAEIAPKLNDELTQNMEVRTIRETRTIAQRIQAEKLISRQEDIGQGPRNTKRAQIRAAKRREQELKQLLGADNYRALKIIEAQEKQQFAQEDNESVAS